MYTGKQIFDLAMDLIQKRQPNGVIDANKTASYRALAPGLLTLWQSEISKNGDLLKTYPISNKPIVNMLGQNNGFDYVEYTGTEKVFEALGSVKAYYFEVDGECTVYIEDYTNQWNTLATITVDSSVTSFTGYKGVVTSTNGAIKSRMRFTGPYRYLITNYAMFNLPVAPTRIPIYQPWVKVELPSNFKSIDQVVTEYPQRQYAKDSNYKLENRRDFYFNYYFEGKMRIVYRPVPIQITDLAQTLEVDEITSMSGAYFLASHLMLIEDPDSANFYLQKYQELKLDAVVKQPLPIQNIVDVYKVNYGGGVSGSD